MKATMLIAIALLMSMALLTMLALTVAQPVAAQISPHPQVTPSALAVVLADTPLDKAYQHLEEVMDKCHRSFVVYADLSDPCNHFLVPALMGSGVTIDNTFTGTVHSGTTAIKVTFTPPLQPPYWGGVYLQNGVLQPDQAQPEPNWGDYPNAGYNLTGATQLTFWARGAKGGERVEFFTFGIGRNYWGPFKPYPDSSPKVTLCGLITGPNMTCYITLTNTWKPYTITLGGLDLSYIIGGFGFATDTDENNGKSIAFYLDDIQYDGPSRLDEPRFLVSFETISTTPVITFDIVNKNVAFTYDNALALIAFTAIGNRERATLLADAFVYCQEHDRYYTDGRKRNAYSAGDLTVPPGWITKGGEGTCTMPGWWDAEKQQWVEDAEHVGSGTGNLAWVMIALLNYYEKWGGEKYLTTIITLGNWIEIHTRDTRGEGGYTGGYTRWEPTPTKFLWKSTEHNLDLYVAFEHLYWITCDEIWRERAQHARDFIEKAMWNNHKGIYETGTKDDGKEIFSQIDALDAQTWSLMALGANERTRRALDYVELNHYITHTYTYSGDEIVFEGFDFNTDRDMPWPEGTGQIVVAHEVLNETPNAQYYLSELQELQMTAINGNKKGVVAAPHDGLTTGLHWEYFNRLHIGATSWFIFGELSYNPYYSVSIQKTPIVGHTIYLPIIGKLMKKPKC